MEGPHRVDQGPDHLGRAVARAGEHVEGAVVAELVRTPARLGLC